MITLDELRNRYTELAKSKGISDPHWYLSERPADDGSYHVDIVSDNEIYLAKTERGLELSRYRANSVDEFCEMYLHNQYGGDVVFWKKYKNIAKGPDPMTPSDGDL